MSFLHPKNRKVIVNEKNNKTKDFFKFIILITIKNIIYEIRMPSALFYSSIAYIFY
ncbi:MAG: hypothetical protein RLZ56_7 [Bacteroidota bacterium]|jgi:hypothetical protein